MVEKITDKGLLRSTKKIEREFKKYGFNPFNLKKVNLGRIKESVQEMVANQLFEIVRLINFYAWKSLEEDTKKNRCYLEKDAGEGIIAVLVNENLWLDKCRIKDEKIGVIETSFRLDSFRTPIGTSEEHWAKIELEGREIFFAEYGWSGVNPDSIRIVSTSAAKKTFEILKKKAEEVKEKKKARGRSKNK